MRSLVTACTLVTLVGCATAPPPAVSEPAPLSDWSAALAAPAGTGAALSGAVSVQSGGAHVSAAISLGGSQPGAEHPWHIHRGRCGAAGPIVGDPSAYPPLRPAGDGRATAQVQLATALLADSAYSVNVHASPTNMSTIIACGDLAMARRP